MGAVTASRAVTVVARAVAGRCPNTFSRPATTSTQGTSKSPRRSHGDCHQFRRSRLVFRLSVCGAGATPRGFASRKLVLDQGWADGYTVNGQAPQPLTQGSADGRITYGLGHIPAGDHVTFWLSLQVNPTTIGHHGQVVRLYDGKTQLAVVHRSIFIFP